MWPVVICYEETTEKDFFERRGIFKGNINSEDKEVFEEITLTEDGSQMVEQANGEINQRGYEKNGGDRGREKNVTVQEHQGSKKDKGVERSKTVAYHSSASPARIPRRKHSQKVRTHQTITPNCTICYGDYTQPKQLPCLHTFCQNCLEKFVNPKLMVECPTCREVILEML